MYSSPVCADDGAAQPEFAPARGSLHAAKVDQIHATPRHASLEDDVVWLHIPASTKTSIISTYKLGEQGLKPK